MNAKRPNVRKGRPRHLVPEPLPDDLYDYADETTSAVGPQRRRSPLLMVDLETLPVMDDWPDRVPVTAAEVDIFERYFGDVLDRLFGPAGDPDTDGNGLHDLPPDGNQKQ